MSLFWKQLSGMLTIIILAYGQVVYQSIKEEQETVNQKVVKGDKTAGPAGLSLDILCAGNTDMDITQSYEPGNHWLLQHCAEYGFILRYPADKEEITGIDYEPWHFRYVGKKAAKQIMKQGITLEEYVGEEGV